ncbi:multiple sugar transport system substrate-binding protein [Inquilinus ginsengisoli]|jgi:multiple sugar transport system substrate-binding protein|uniref:ABC transporter substrate-binding protein n=1 Tax=Inquilinus ginsengisoli TaxID=363840 RepID=UPI003D247540
MTIQGDPNRLWISRRQLLGYSAGAALATAIGRVPGAAAAENLGAVTQEQWTPEFIGSIAGTVDVDTAAECAKVVPLDYKGRLTYWYVGPNQASTPFQHKLEAEFWDAFAKTYPNITVEKQSIDYNEIPNKLRTAALGRAAPMVARLMLLWGCEFAAKGFLQELKPEDVGYPSSEFWPRALRSATWKDKTYGIPTNNETMAFIWNADLFHQAGLDPENPPATWDDVVAYSKQIKDQTGKQGYGLVARRNAGNTPYRFMPQMWAYGGGALDEAEPNPTYQKILIDNDGSRAALQAVYNMYVRDRSVPVSALTNAQTENQDPFIAGRLGMMISHPTEYATMLDRAARATGDDKKMADAVVQNMRYGLIPRGPARRAVVFGGWNVHMFNPDVVDGDFDADAARAFIAFSTGPEWSTKLNWEQSNPGNLRGFRTKWMKQRLEQIKFLNVTTSMLPSGIPFPVIPESTEIMNIIVPDMMQNALTEKMTVGQATQDAAKKIKDIFSPL